MTLPVEPPSFGYRSRSTAALSWYSQTCPAVRIGDRGPSNVLMVQNERDPGTPLVGARKLRQAFGDRARLVPVDQGGHGVYPFGADTCAKDSVTAFLTTGNRPARDVACAAEPIH